MLGFDLFLDIFFFFRCSLNNVNSLKRLIFPM